VKGTFCRRHVLNGLEFSVRVHVGTKRGRTLYLRDLLLDFPFEEAESERTVDEVGRICVQTGNSLVLGCKRSNRAILNRCDVGHVDACCLGNVFGLWFEGNRQVSDFDQRRATRSQQPQFVNLSGNGSLGHPENIQPCVQRSPWHQQQHNMDLEWLPPNELVRFAVAVWTSAQLTCVNLLGVASGVWELSSTSVGQLGLYLPPTGHLEQVDQSPTATTTTPPATMLPETPVQWNCSRLTSSSGSATTGARCGLNPH